MAGLEDFDCYVDEHGMPEEDYPAAFALRIAEVTGGPVPRFEKVQRGESEDGVVIEGDDIEAPSELDAGVEAERRAG